MPFDISSLYDTARAVLDQVVHEDGSVERLNETETRTHVIDPLIKAMGYETLDQVRREYHLSASGHFIDYLLTAGDQRVVVEAKPLGTALSARESSQLVGYCAQEGVRWALLTNGLAWIVFDTEISGNWEAKQITTIDLLDAYRSGRLAAAVRPLGYFALDTLAVDAGLVLGADGRSSAVARDAGLDRPARGNLHCAIKTHFPSPIEYRECYKLS